MAYNKIKYSLKKNRCVNNVIMKLIMHRVMVDFFLRTLILRTRHADDCYNLTANAFFLAILIQRVMVCYEVEARTPQGA